MDASGTNRRQKADKNSAKTKQRIIKLDIGSGYIRHPGYTRIDIDPNIDADIRLDICSLHKLPPDYVNEIYTAHTLEHTAPKDTFQILRNCWRILENNGKLTVIVPDIYRASADWVRGKIDDTSYAKIALGADPTATPYMIHLNIFSEKKLKRFLLVVGFQKIKRQETKNKYELRITARKVV